MDLSPQTTTTSGLSDKSWLQSTHGIDENLAVTLDLTLFDAATHYPDGSIRSGHDLGLVTASGFYGPYDNTADDGREVCRGHLFEDEKVNAGSTRAGVALYRHGAVKRDNLPATGGHDAAAEADVPSILYS